ncbi:hypothetical protein B0H13DRAFT_1851348 [Mycena leptocephala]|nr:hypothetical protein B0H13DRAFT_1851348 [Mycena leptocephala]
MTMNGVLPLEIPGKGYSPQFRGVVIGTVVGQELTAGGQGVNVRLSHPVGCTEEVKDLFKKQTMLLCAVETVDSGDNFGQRLKAKILRWTETGFFPNSSNLAMRVPHEAGHYERWSQ